MTRGVFHMIPVTSFAGKTVAVFGLGGSGLASCHALKAGGAEVIAGDDSADNVAKAAQAGFITADLRTVSWAIRGADPDAGCATDSSGTTLERAGGAQAGVEVIGDIDCSAGNGGAMRPTRRSWRSPARTANRLPRR